MCIMLHSMNNQMTTYQVSLFHAAPQYFRSTTAMLKYTRSVLILLLFIIPWNSSGTAQLITQLGLKGAPCCYSQSLHGFSFLSVCLCLSVCISCRRFIHFWLRSWRLWPWSTGKDCFTPHTTPFHSVRSPSLLQTSLCISCECRVWLLFSPPQPCLWMVSRPRMTRLWLTWAPCSSPGKFQAPGMNCVD